jgi:bacterial/archaeal transporter family-2 protein
VMDQLFIPLSLAAGAVLAIHAGANAQLSKALQSPFAATTLQLGIGALFLFVVTGLTGEMTAFARLPDATWWHAAGGVASAFFVVSTILLFPRIGAVVSVGLLIAGQILASAALDMFGLLGIAATGFRMGVVIGATMVMVGAAVIVRGQQNSQFGVDQRRAGWFVLALLAGAALPIQGAANALLRHDLGGAAFAVSTVSFVVATLAAGAALTGSRAAFGARPLNFRDLSALSWWGWLGGIAGATYVTTVFTAIPVIGTSATVGLTIAGQQIAAIFVDKFGWFRLPQRPVSGARLVGVALLLAGVVVIKTI